MCSKQVVGGTRNQLALLAVMPAGNTLGAIDPCEKTGAHAELAICSKHWLLEIPYSMKKIKVLILSLTCSVCSYAQTDLHSTLNVAGATASKGYYSFDWSVGESTAITTIASGNSMLTQGVLQYHSGNVVDRNFAMTWFHDEVRLFPNPVDNFLEVDFKHLVPGRIHLQLSSKSGQILWQKELDYNGVSRVEKLNMSGLPAGNYTLYILQDRVPDRYGHRIYYKRGAFNIVKVH
jgi:hypothetical protein